MELPEWLTPADPRKGGRTFIADPDIFYPAFLKELGVGEDAVDQYWLEVCYGCMKRDARFHVGVSGFNLYVRGDDGRKMRWNLTMHKPGKEDISSPLKTKQRNRAVREHFKRIRGF